MNTIPATKQRPETTYYTFEFKRSYKDNDGSWKETQSFSKHDISKVEVCLSKIKEFLFLSVPKDPEDDIVTEDVN